MRNNLLLMDDIVWLSNNNQSRASVRRCQAVHEEHWIVRAKLRRRTKLLRVFVPTVGWDASHAVTEVPEDPAVCHSKRTRIRHALLLRLKEFPTAYGDRPQSPAKNCNCTKYEYCQHAFRTFSSVNLRFRLVVKLWRLIVHGVIVDCRVRLGGPYKIYEHQILHHD